MPSFGEAYRATRERMTDLVRSTPERMSEPVPACPDWSVKDLIAHVAGVARDMVEGNLDGVGQDHWTAAHIERGAGLSLEELLDGWAETGIQIEAALDNVPRSMAGLTVADLVTHEHDLRNALGKPGARDSDGVKLTVNAYGRLKSSHLKGAERALRLRAGGREWIAGDRDVTASVEASEFELMRALSGRRTDEEITGLDWNGESEHFVTGFGLFSHPVRSIGE